MAQAYADSQKSDDTGDGLSWANAELTKAAADVDAGALGEVFVQDGTSGGYLESTAGAVIYTLPGTLNSPSMNYACKTGTSNEPPTASDLVPDKTHSDVAELKTTSGNLTLAGFGYYWGFKFASDAGTLNVATLSSAAHLVFEQCILVSRNSSTGIRVGNVQTSIELIDSDVDLSVGTSATIADSAGGSFSMKGGTVQCGGSGVGFFVRPLTNSKWLFDGVDLSEVGAAGGINFSSSGALVELLNCEIPVSFVLVDAVDNNIKGIAKMVGCDSSSDHTNTIRQYRYEVTTLGYIADDTPFISGGAQDRGSGDGYSFSMNPGDNKVLERFWPLQTEWFSFTVEPGDTSVTFEILRKDSGAPADLDNETCWIEIQSPNEGVGSATAQFASQSSRAANPKTTAAALTSSSATWSGLGGETAKKQKIVFTISPEYVGRARYRVAYAERGSSILPLYFDQRPTVA